MPKGDGTGPAGLGPLTGRAAGYCSGNQNAGFTQRGFYGRGSGCRTGGRGHRNRFIATGLPFWARNGNQSNFLSKEEELKILKNYSSYMQNNIEEINKRINDLENQKNQ